MLTLGRRMARDKKTRSTATDSETETISVSECTLIPETDIERVCEKSQTADSSKCLDAGGLLNSKIMDFFRRDMSNMAHKIPSLFEDEEGEIQILCSKLECQRNIPSYANIVDNTKDKVKAKEKIKPQSLLIEAREDRETSTSVTKSHSLSSDFLSATAVSSSLMKHANSIKMGMN